MAERKILHYEIDNTSESGKSFTSYGSISLLDGVIDRHSDDTDSMFGAMGCQHGYYVLESIAEWARNYKTHSEECVYKFDVDGYKGKIHYIGFRYRIENEIPLSATSLRSLLYCYMHSITDIALMR